MATVDEVRITVSGKNIDVTPALKSYVEKRVTKALKHFDPERQAISVDVVLGVQRGTHTAEVTLHVGKLLVRSEAETHDLYASIDEATDRLARQIRKYKTRLHRRGVQGPKLAEVAPGPAPAEDERDGAVDALPEVVRTKRFAIKPMSVQEAILQMELLGHDFFVFADAETHEVHVLYRRKDGQLGLIEPQVE